MTLNVVESPPPVPLKVTVAEVVVNPLEEEIKRTWIVWPFDMVLDVADHASPLMDIDFAAPLPDNVTVGLAVMSPTVMVPEVYVVLNDASVILPKSFLKPNHELTRIKPDLVEAASKYFVAGFAVAFVVPLYQRFPFCMVAVPLTAIAPSMVMVFPEFHTQFAPLFKVSVTPVGMVRLPPSNPSTAVMVQEELIEEFAAWTIPAHGSVHARVIELLCPAELVAVNVVL